MSIIIQDKGLLSTVVTSSDALDQLSPQIANKLVGNDVDEKTIEMVIRPAKIQFTEPTVIAFSGALFDVTVGDKTLSANRMYILDRGDVLTFHSSDRGGRVYLAVAGGIKKSGTNVLESGDELTMRRNYTEQHHEIFSMMRNKPTVAWGIGSYSLAEVYLSDNFHVVRRPGVPESVYEELEDTYTVIGETYRYSIKLEGNTIDYNSEAMDNYGVQGGIFLKDNKPFIALNDFDMSTEYTHIGTIPSYHMHKIAQKTKDSKVQFTVIDAEHAYVNLYNHEMWKKSLFKAIDYKISKELVKEKM
ncbi:hypothetical protein [Nosocomiicoccus ampullae]|uniref:hypothetical protein n=1 Tax=Nosocomiicoccus ampullae TaxID=489910 RepID=UPI001C6057D8|nr:hypothetical protein [Nosocomiicoccus ampullae]QYA48727.1 hypothetical protein KPF52_01405 [Nosocomiicoccus ampullae]